MPDAFMNNGCSKQPLNAKASVDAHAIFTVRIFAPSFHRPFIAAPLTASAEFSELSSDFDYALRYTIESQNKNEKQPL
ncbi:MAG: hypothetical protein IBJ15_14425 [Alphaproteobacteria bacterium]|nr:hypothetical protein [Alphaproteobacteria bacterium]